jgi:PTH1 family peptidyl-tRNA hydrolase
LQTNVLFVIFGLGNPGETYRATRHNVGFEVVDRLATRHRIDLATRRFGAVLGQGAIAGRRVWLLEPQTFMNLSGESVAAAMQAQQVPLERIVVLHDDMDLELGRIQVRPGGGDGGHRGVRSVIEHLGAMNFARIRLGVGRPGQQEEASDHVLSGFSDEEGEQVEALIERGANAAQAWLSEGLVVAMNRYNPWKGPGQRGIEGGPDERA